MKRYFYLCDDFGELEKVEAKLEEKGINTAQIHVISNDETELDKHKLHQVHQWFQTDVVTYTLMGAVIGAVLAATLIGVAYASGLRDEIGWFLFLFLSIVVLGFCTWEAGFIGTQLPNRHFKRFKSALDSGQHLFMVDVGVKQEEILSDVSAQHPCLKSAGVKGKGG